MAILLNLLVPGLGSLVAGRRGAGIAQLLLFLVGLSGVIYLTHTGIPLAEEGDLRGLTLLELARIFVPPSLLLVAFGWALATGVSVRRARAG